jgi:hypothetical protein
MRVVSVCLSCLLIGENVDIYRYHLDWNEWDRKKKDLEREGSLLVSTECV